MLEIPLQVSEALDPTQFEAAMMAINVLKAFVGLGIAYIAYRGYQRNESRPMLYLSLGFVLVLGVPFVLFLVGIPFVALFGPPSVAEQGVVAASELSQLIGLFVIVYALRL